MRIGLMGAVIDNGNMGCVALTYSLILGLELIEARNNERFEYVVFDTGLDVEKLKILENELSVEPGKIRIVRFGGYGCFKDIVRHPKINIQMINEIKKCDAIIDITQGDSFADIYGDKYYRAWLRAKQIVEQVGVPLILAPQTYGPFNKIKNRNEAKKVIEKATLVISRDQKSADYLGHFANKKIYVTTDLAFMLPFQRHVENQSKIKVGINVSGLLVSNKQEKMKTEFTLKTDYDKFLNDIITQLINDDKYEVHLIPHVAEDYVSCKTIADKSKNIYVHGPFYSPIDAKNCIAGMDVFIGARMHATIAAFSAGIATIPTAYSRKFSGLFQNLGYMRVVDLQNESTERAEQLTMQYIEVSKELKQEVEKCIPAIQAKTEKTLALIEQALLSKRKD